VPGRVLGVDFGSSSTAAVLRWPDGRVRPLLFDGSPLLPSAVFVDPHGALLTGRDARHAAVVAPQRFEPNPKRRVDEGSVLLGEQTWPVAGLIAAVLRRVAEEAVRAGGGPVDELVLTHPVAWGGPRREVLLRAAALAGLPEPRLVPEPVAAAGYFVSVLGQALPVGAGVLVYDLGAGTFDATAVRRTARGFEVLTTAGLPDAGGLDIDAAILAHLRGAYPDHDFGVLDGEQHQRDRLQLWDNIRSAKEALSRLSGTVVPVPVLGLDAPLGRESLDGIAGPVLRRTLAASTAAVRAFGGVGVPVFLVGGASRMPAVALGLHRLFGAPPVVIEQPELVVAEGSLYAVPAGSETVVAQADAGPTQPVAGGPGWSAPVTVAQVSGGPFAAAPAGPPSSVALPTAPVGAGLVSPGAGWPVQQGGAATVAPTGGIRPAVPLRRVTPLRRAAVPLSLAVGLVATVVLAPEVGRQAGQHALSCGVRAPFGPTGAVACLAVLLLLSLRRPTPLRLVRPAPPRPARVLALAGWATLGLVGALGAVAGALRAGAGWRDVPASDSEVTVEVLRGTGRVLLVGALAVAVGLVAAALLLLGGRSREDPWTAGGARAAGAGALGGALVAALAATHLFDLTDPFAGLSRDPVLFLADEVLGASGVLAAVRAVGLFAVAAFAVVVALLFATVALRGGVDSLSRRAGSFVTGTGYGVCAALGVYLAAHAWYELRYWAGAPALPQPPGVLLAGHGAWAASWPYALAVLAALAVTGGVWAGRGGASVRRYRR
jgi:hypothetical protein